MKRVSPKDQCGVVLLVGLIMLMLLSLIGVTGMQTTGLEQKMTANQRDRNLAFQAAEAALRDAELDIKNLKTDKTKAAAVPHISGLVSFQADCGASTVNDTFDDGLCYNGPAGYTAPIWQTTNMDPAIDNGKPAITYGTYTAGAPIPGISRQPRYLIEGLRYTAPGSSSKGVYYRITVRAQGANENTVVWLQEFFKQ